LRCAQRYKPFSPTFNRVVQNELKYSPIGSCTRSEEPVTAHLRGGKMSLNLSLFPVMANMESSNVTSSVQIELNLVQNPTNNRNVENETEQMYSIFNSETLRLYPVMAHMESSNISSSLLMGLDLVHKPKKERKEENEKEKLYFIVHSENEMNKLMKNPELPNVYIDSYLTQRMKYLASLAIPDKKPTMYRSKLTSTSNYESISSYFYCYRNLESSMRTMRDIEESYPKLAEVVKIGKSYLDEYDILVLKLTNKESLFENKAKMFAMFGLHAREYSPPELGARFAETLVQKYAEDAEITYILDTVEIHIVLQANPDGRKIAETRPELYWRKNANPSNGCEGSTYGVDLNRNFPCGWGRTEGWASSNDPCSLIYHGKEAASEPETKALVEYVRTFFEQNETGVFHDVHSFGKLLTWPYGYKEGVVTPDQDEFVALALKFKKMNGYLLAGPDAKNLYGASFGTSLDYAYAEKRLMAVTLELGNDFYQECNVFDSDIYPRNLDVLLYSAKISGNPFDMSMGPDIKILSLGSNKIPQDSSFCLFAELLQADKVMPGYSSHQGKEDQFGDVTATLYIDSVQIENFDLSKSIQKFNFSLEITDLDIGQHMLHLEGTDEYGYIGPKSSIFFEVCDITKDETCKENTAPCPPINPNCAEVTVTITTDDYPQETSFRIFDSYTEPMSGSGYTGQRSTYTTNGCLSYGMYEFIIKDSKGDGMCCSYGNGSYELKVNGSVRKTGGQFTDSESTIFSTSPVPASTSAPNSGNCMNVVVIIKTDIYPEETSFKVVNQNGIEFMSGDSYTTKLYEYPASSCLPNSNIYQFTIYDTADDGLCCTHGAGGYNLFVNGVIIKSGGVFTNSETAKFPSNAPVSVPTNLSLTAHTTSPVHMFYID